MKCCCCNKEIKKEDNYFIGIDPGEDPEYFCDRCVTIEV